MNFSIFANFKKAIAVNQVQNFELKMFEDIEYERREVTTRGRILTFAILNKGHDDLEWFFADAFPYFNEQICKVVREYGKVRVNARLTAEFESVIRTGYRPSTKKNAIYIHTRTVTVDCETNIAEIYNETIKKKILEKIKESSCIKEMLIQVNSLNVHSVEVEFRESAFRRRMLTFAIVNKNQIELNPFFEDAFPHFEKQINKILREHGMIKVNICLSLEFEKIVQSDDGPKSEKQTVYIRTPNSEVDCGTNLGEYYKKIIQATLLQKLDDVIMRGSGFTLCSINEITIQVNKYEPLSGSSYMVLPKFLQDKMAIINVQNHDQECFRWAILSALHTPNDHAERVTKYNEHKNKYNFNGIEFPVKIKDITKFESQNADISINVYHCDEEEERIYPIRLTKETKRNHINLLLLMVPHSTKDSNEDSEFINGIGDFEVESHYCWIRHLSRAVNSQVSKNCRKIHICDRCLCHFRTKIKLEAHKIQCMKQNHTAIEMPELCSNINFQNYDHKLKISFAVYADVETLLKQPSQDAFGNSSSTRTMQEHEVISVGLYFHCFYNN